MEVEYRRIDLDAQLSSPGIRIQPLEKFKILHRLQLLRLGKMLMELVEDQLADRLVTCFVRLLQKLERLFLRVRLNGHRIEAEGEECLVDLFQERRGFFIRRTGWSGSFFGLGHVVFIFCYLL